LDDVAWNIQERAESGSATQEEYLQAFAKARAAAAVGFALVTLVEDLDLDTDAVLAQLACGPVDDHGDLGVRLLGTI